MIDTGIVDLLTADSGVSAIATGGISPNVLPLIPAYPAIVYQAASPKSDEVIGGVSSYTQRFRFQCCALSYAEAANLANAVHALLDNFNGALPNGGLHIQVIDQQPVPDFYINDSKVYVKTIDFVFFF